MISEGCYVLRTNVADLTAQQTWQTYVQLTQTEAAFAILQKSELSLRPAWHPKERRVRSHILGCFLAYVLWKTFEQWQSPASLGNNPRAARRVRTPSQHRRGAAADRRPGS